MSSTHVRNTTSYSLSPAGVKFKMTPKHSMNASVYQDVEGFRPTLKMSHTVGQFSGNLSKLINISAKKIQPKPSLIGSHLRETGKNYSVIASEAKASGFENIIRKKLVKEEKLAKKLQVLVTFCEKLAGSSNTFKVFAEVFNDIAVAIQKDLKELKKYKKGQVKLDELCDNLKNEVDELKNENKKLLIELDNNKSEKKALNSRIKKQSNLLNELKTAGLPVEEIYEKLKAVQVRPKFSYKTQVLMKNEEVIKIPKLFIRDHGQDEGYHEEFMSKFKEFSESWREQIMKNHHSTN